MLLAAASTASALSRSSTTPPTSLLWVMSGESTFSATGKPISAAQAAASAALTAVRVLTTGMP